MQQAEEERYMATLTVVKKVNEKKRARKKRPTEKRLEVIKTITGKNDGKEVSGPSREGGK